MKFCTKCSCINLEKAIQCRSCGVEFQKSESIPADQLISLQSKIYLLVVTWVVAIIMVLFVSNFELSSLALFPFLAPVGLPVFIIVVNAEPNSQGGLFIAAALGWLYYAFLTTWSLISKRWRTCLTVYAVILVSLLFNIVSCEALKHANFRTEKKLFTNTGQVCQSGSFHPTCNP